MMGHLSSFSASGVGNSNAPGVAPAGGGGVCLSFDLSDT